MGSSERRVGALPGARLQVVADADALSERAAAIFEATVRRKKSALIALPTGRTPLGLYERLAARRKRGLDLSRVRVVSIDEYVGVDPEDPVSLFGWLRRVAIEPLGIAPERVLRVPSDATDLERACRSFDRRIARLGGLDLAVLGLGWNGHVAFNEPGSTRSSPTRPVALEAGTVARNRRYWRGRRVPGRAVTIGLATLLRAKRILLLVSGSPKAELLAAAVSGPATPKVPASLLRFGNTTVVADRAAAARVYFLPPGGATT